MRKILSITLLVIMMISVVACGNEQTGSVEKAEKYCLWCGANNLETAAFCGSCGTSFGDTSALSTPEIQATATPTSRATSAPISTPRPTATPVAVTELHVSNSDKEQEMLVNETLALAENITIYPSAARNQTLTWKSSNTSVATVDKNGNVTAKSGGNTKITATAASGASVSVDINVFDIKLPSLPLQLSYYHKYNGILKANIIKLTPIVTSYGTVKVKIEGEAVVVDMVDKYLYFIAEITDPDGYVYNGTCSFGVPDTPGAKFKDEEILFTASSFGSDKLTPGKYTVVFKERNIT